MDISNAEDEIKEWVALNRMLRHAGLPLIDPPNPVETSLSDDNIAFDLEMAKRIRENMTSLMNDVKRRQELVQELIQTNNQLREELSAQTTVSERYESRSRDLRAMLENSKSKVEALESEMQNTTFTKESEVEATRNTMGEMRTRVKQLQEKCRAGEEEVQRLKDKVSKMNKEEERRIEKQSHVMQQLRKRGGGRSLDDKVLDLVESYERQVASLQRQLNSYLPENERLQNGDEEEGTEATPQYKALVKAYEKEIRDCKKKQKTLENDVNLLQLELQGRPELKDLRDCQSKLKKLERIVKKHNLLGTEEKMAAIEKKKYSTLVDDIEFLPLPHCRSYLKIICNELGVFDLDHVTTKVKKTAKAVEAHPRLEEFAKQVLSVLDTEQVARPPGVDQVTRSGSHHEIWCEKSWHHAIPLLKYWRQQLESLQELEQSIRQLSHTLLPWRQLEQSTGVPTVSNLISHVDAIIYETKDDSGENKCQKSKGSHALPEQSSRAMLQGILDHFMNLFDVAKVTGCYARMNDVYAKLGETHNVLKTLRDLLGLKRDCKSPVIIDSVSRLCQLHDHDAHAQIQQLFPEEDQASIVRKLKLHNEFFPVFHQIMTQLMQLTDVTRIDQVVPAVKALKILQDAR